MPNIKSAKKRVSVTERRHEENRYVKSTMATMVKKFRLACEQDAAKASEMLPDIISYIDSAASKGVIHQNTASRKVARLNLLLNKANATKKVEAKEAPAKKEPKTKTAPKAKAEPKVAPKAKAEKKEKVEKEEKPAKKTTKKTTK